MNRHVNAIANRLSLRPPQRRSLEILDRVSELSPLTKSPDLSAALAGIQAEFPSVKGFDRDFVSLCFALATGVGKTRLMGAFISYLHLAHGLNNFFVLAPNLTIYNKLITDFTPNTPKYVFTGISEFATQPPEIVTGDNYEGHVVTQTAFSRVTINIFNISKINTEVRGGNMPRIKRLAEYIGDSYFNYLAKLPDLVLIMDESHRYRASAGARAINELKPVIGLELTATPFVGDTVARREFFSNVVFDYPLGKAIEDGFVKDPAVVTRRDFIAAGVSDDDMDRLKLEDGLRLHESVKVELETFARENGRKIVKPFVLVVAQNTAHADQIKALISSDGFFNGRYRDKVIQVDSKTKEEEFVDRLLKVERADEPTEIVIHVNMLQEGWDVTNLYTIIPLRAAAAPRLIEQTIGRGLRLPYGGRTGVASVDRLNIIAHDKFQEIIDEANRPGSAIRLQRIILDPSAPQGRLKTVVSQPTVLTYLFGENTPSAPGSSAQPALFPGEAERQIAQLAYKELHGWEGIRRNSDLESPEVQAALADRVRQRMVPRQLEMGTVLAGPDIEAVVRQSMQAVAARSIDIPRIVVVPKGEVTVEFKPFKIDMTGLNYQPVSRELVIQSLSDTEKREFLADGGAALRERRLEDHVVRGLVDFDDISYDHHADLLYDLAGQVVGHLRTYLSDEEARGVLIHHQAAIARFIHAQMSAHQIEMAAGYEVRITGGFSTLVESAFTVSEDEPVHPIRETVPDLSRIPSMVFGGFSRCLYNRQKFQSNPERLMALILERESIKWFKPAKGQFKIHYQLGPEQKEYVPDFVAESASAIHMIETKRRAEMEAVEVLSKKEAAVLWCERATNYCAANGGKPWVYLLVPADVVAENMTLDFLAKSFR